MSDISGLECSLTIRTLLSIGVRGLFDWWVGWVGRPSYLVKQSTMPQSFQRIGYDVDAMATGVMSAREGRNRPSGPPRSAALAPAWLAHQNFAGAQNRAQVDFASAPKMAIAGPRKPVHGFLPQEASGPRPKRRSRSAASPGAQAVLVPLLRNHWPVLWVLPMIAARAGL